MALQHWSELANVVSTDDISTIKDKDINHTVITENLPPQQKQSSSFPRPQVKIQKL